MMQSVKGKTFNCQVETYCYNTLYMTEANKARITEYCTFKHLKRIMIFMFFAWYAHNGCYISSNW